MKMNALPIKWRLTVWSSLWMCIFFVLYNSAQYFVLDRWILVQEENSIRNSMDEIQGYYVSNSSKDIMESLSFLEKVNQKDQLIRVIDLNGKVLLTISEELPEQWVQPKQAVRTSLVRTWHNKDHLLIIRNPIDTDSLKGTIEIIRNLEDYERLNKLLLVVMALGALGGIAFSTFGGFMLARQYVKPIARLSAVMEKIKYGGLAERVHFIDNKDELSKLSQMFNEMMDQLEVSFQQQNQFIEDASHELRTPIAIIEGHLSLLARWGKDDPSVLNESLTASLEELNRLKSLTKDLIASSDIVSNRIEPEWSEPTVILTKVVDNYRVLYPEFTFEVEYNQLAGIHLAIPEHHLTQILIIVLDNAIKYSRQYKKIQIGGKISIHHSVELQIIDNGLGIPKEHIPHVFDRFYRVDKARSRKIGGSGLGLSIAKRLVKAYEGSIRLTSVEGQGTSVTITLPLGRRKLI